jgi:hypothetical protein
LYPIGNLSGWFAICNMAARARAKVNVFKKYAPTKSLLGRFAARLLRAEEKITLFWTQSSGNPPKAYLVGLKGRR